jgi:hypothetical protein
MLNATEAANVYLAAPFVDYLKKTNDPRLRSIAVRYVGAIVWPRAGSSPRQYRPRRTDRNAFWLRQQHYCYLFSKALNKFASFYEFSTIRQNAYGTKIRPQCFW